MVMVRSRAAPFGVDVLDSATNGAGGGATELEQADKVMAEHAAAATIRVSFMQIPLRSRVEGV
jgi:hypothetical protein